MTTTANTTLKEYKHHLVLEKNLSDHTVTAYLTDVGKLQDFLQKEKQQALLSAQKEHLNDFLEHIHLSHMSPYSQARIVSSLKSFFRYLCQEEYRKDNPTEFLQAPQLPKYLLDVLSYEEIERMIDHIDLSLPTGHRDRALIETLYGSGLRVSELVQLKLEKLFLDIGFARITGKGDKERLVPLGSDSMKHIKLYLTQERSRWPVQDKHQAYVFLNRRGTRLSRVSVFNLVKKLAQQMGLNKRISPHTFRHSFATHMIARGADLRAVQDMLGHASITTTEIYTHADKAFLRKTIQTFHPRR